MKVIRLALPLLGLLVLSLIFWYAVIPGIVLGFIFRGRWERLVTLLSSVVIICASKIATWSWMPAFDLYFGPWVLAEALSFVLAWLWCGFLFFAGYRVERFCRAGYESAKRTEQDGDRKPDLAAS